MPGTPMGRKMVWWIVSAVAALAVLGGGWALTAGRDGGSADSGSGLSSGSTTGDQQDGSDGGTQTTSPASESTTKAGGGNAAAGGSAGGSTGGGSAANPGGGSSGSDSDADAPGGASPPAPGAPQGTFYIRIAWWNDTVERPPAGFVLKWGSSGTWAPDSVRRSQVGTIGPFLVGTPQSFRVYPDGDGRSAGTVSFTIKPGMVSGSEQDGIHVEVRDSSVFVLGNPVSNGEMTFTRP